jgi:His/Glu/Gln/Arg/opine family amino acid ABC transporter permease subunit
VSEAVLYDAVGPRGRRRIVAGSVVGLLVIAAILAVALARMAAKGAFEADLWRLLTRADVQRLLARGLAATLRAALLAMALSMAVGALLAVGRLSRRRWLARPVGAWVELFRGLPLLLLILFVFLGLPAVGVTVSTFWALVGGLTLYNGAVLGEIFRAGILSLPVGQTEAAYAIGLRRRPGAAPGAAPPGGAADAAGSRQPARHPPQGHVAGVRDRLRRAAPQRPQRGGVPRRPVLHPDLHGHRGRLHRGQRVAVFAGSLAGPPHPAPLRPRRAAQRRRRGGLRHATLSHLWNMEVPIWEGQVIPSGFAMFA